jgi:hypothetical protein
MIKWYAVSIIILVKFKDGIQDIYPIWENIVLIKAESTEKAFEKAENKGKEYEGDSHGTYEYDGRPATLVFAGVRKLIECVDSDERPDDGTEVTYSMLSVKSNEALAKLVNGEEVSVIYEE